MDRYSLIAPENDFAVTVADHRGFLIDTIAYCGAAYDSACDFRFRMGIKAWFRRRASAVPNLIAIRFDSSTAEARL